MHKFEHEVTESLQERSILLAGVFGQQGDEFFGHLIKGTVGQFWVECTFRLAELEVFLDGFFGRAAVKLEETAPGDGTEDIGFGRQQMGHQMDECLYGGTSREQQGFARNDVHAIWAIRVLVFVAKQGLGHPTAFLVPSAEDDDVTGSESLLLQFDDGQRQLA